MVRSLLAGCVGLAFAAIAVGQTPDSPGGGTGATHGTPQPPPPHAAPLPDLGGGVPPPGVVLGLTPDELLRLVIEPNGTPLAAMRSLAEGHARLGDPVLTILPGRHLIDRRFNRAVPPGQALDLGFLGDWNDLVEALSLAWLATGNVAYALRVDDHLRPWQNYRPPMGSGDSVGGEPSIYHREFRGALRAAEHCWPVLSPAAKSAAVHLARVFQDRVLDWWSRTSWVRANHAAATAQSGLHAALFLLRVAHADPTLIPVAEAERRLRRFLDDGRALNPATLVGGSGQGTGLVGLLPQVAVAIRSPDNAATWLARGWPDGLAWGTTIDLIDHPADSRMAYHALTAYHTISSYWSLVRSGIDLGHPSRAAALRRSLGDLIEASRPYLESGLLLAQATGPVPDPTVDPLARELVAMAAALFPEKAWLAPLPARGSPTVFGELYVAVARWR
ncbi:MAG: hypothetical protein FJ293_13310 [Planctomycetes bacterium]|nr:hypothetical protein [Planctomycetota bacterium]